MKLTSIYYSPSRQRVLAVGQEEITELDNDAIINTLIYADYELIGYFYDN